MLVRVILSKVVDGLYFFTIVFWTETIAFFGGCCLSEWRWTQKRPNESHLNPETIRKRGKRADQGFFYDTIHPHQRNTPRRHDDSLALAPLPARFSALLKNGTATLSVLVEMVRSFVFFHIPPLTIRQSFVLVKFIFASSFTL